MMKHARCVINLVMKMLISFGHSTNIEVFPECCETLSNLCKITSALLVKRQSRKGFFKALSSFITPCLWLIWWWRTIVCPRCVKGGEVHEPDTSSHFWEMKPVAQLSSNSFAKTMWILIKFQHRVDACPCLSLVKQGDKMMPLCNVETLCSCMHVVDQSHG